MKQRKRGQLDQYRPDVHQVIESITQIMFGMEGVASLIIIALLCNDHVLLEDVPGTGKTMLTNTVAKLLDLQFRRIQGTPDLLPGDLTGVRIYNQKKNEFEFVPGPIFTNFLLFDEINRASPKTQSALLEAMAESQVSIDNESYKLKKPFLVIATQNPIEHVGTYPLPQAQLDRFLIKTSIGYPPRNLEKQIMLTTEASVEALEANADKVGQACIKKWQSEYQKVFIDDKLIDKLLNIIEETRISEKFALGISPRASRKLVRALQASAYIHGRDFVSKDDIFDLFLPVMTHRVTASNVGEEGVLLKQMLLAENL